MKVTLPLFPFFTLFPLHPSLFYQIPSSLYRPPPLPLFPSLEGAGDAVVLKNNSSFTSYLINTYSPQVRGKTNAGAGTWSDAVPLG